MPRRTEYSSSIAKYIPISCQVQSMILTTAYLQQMSYIVLILSSWRSSLESLLLSHRLRVLRRTSLLQLLLLLVIFKSEHFRRLFIIDSSLRMVLHLLHPWERFILVYFLFCNCHVMLIYLRLGRRLLESWLFNIVTYIVCSSKPFGCSLIYSSS